MRVHYSPPAVNFNPQELAPAAAAAGGVDSPALLMGPTGSCTAAGSGATPDGHHPPPQQHEAAVPCPVTAFAVSELDHQAGQQQQQQYHVHAGSPAAVVAQHGSTSQLGQQDGSHGTPQGSAGLGRVGSVPPPEVAPAGPDAAAEVEGPAAAAADGGEVVEQHTLREGAGECRICFVAGDRLCRKGDCL